MPLTTTEYGEYDASTVFSKRSPCTSLLAALEVVSDKPSLWCVETPGFVCFSPVVDIFLGFYNLLMLKKHGIPDYNVSVIDYAGYTSVSMTGQTC